MINGIIKMSKSGIKRNSIIQFKRKIKIKYNFSLTLNSLMIKIITNHRLEV